MFISDSMQVYIGKKIGIDDLEPFQTWAFEGLPTKKKKEELPLIQRWNLLHPGFTIKQSMNLWDAVDRMIEIWKERFG